MMLRGIVAVFLLLTGLAAAPPLLAQNAAEPRIALVVGNAAYGAAFGPLANPANDAGLVAKALRESGFDVEVVTNADRRTLALAIIRLGQRVKAAGGKPVGLFYYAGHGMQSHGENYLIPVAAAMASEAELDVEAVPANTVLRQLQEAGAFTSIVILDACRDMPLTRKARTGTRGLARMLPVNGSYIAYSTEPGGVAEDGSGANSLFAQALAKEMAEPNLTIEALFKKVRVAVHRDTAGRQIPATDNMLLGDFIFRFQASSSPLLAECDRLAKIDFDLDGEGFDTQDILPALALPACRDALAAAPGDQRMMTNMGNALYASEDYAGALARYRQAAAAGSTLALVYQAMMHFDGIGVAKNTTQATRLMEEAASKNDTVAMMILASFAIRSDQGKPGDMQRAIEWLGKAAASGNKMAMALLGAAYARGVGVESDVALGRQWIDRAIAAGSAGALTILGEIYRTGNGGTKDPVQARKWFEQAAAKGDDDAMLYLGAMAERGEGMPKSDDMARLWYEQAAAKGNAVAMTNLGMFHIQGLATPKNVKKGQDWLERAAEAGEERAMIDLGDLYFYGDDLPQDYGKAREWYAQAADRSNSYAMYAMGVLHEDGKGTPKDLRAAQSWYERAAAAGSAGAMTVLAEWYRDGHVFQRDIAQARRWFEKAADLGDKTATEELARLPSR